MKGGAPGWPDRRQCGGHVWCDRCGAEWEFGNEPYMCRCYVRWNREDAAELKNSRPQYTDSRGRYIGSRRGK